VYNQFEDHRINLEEHGLDRGDNPAQERLDALVPFFKALADANRLKIIGLLVRQQLSVEQIAEMVELSPSTVSHHLAQLTRAGLVSARAESYYNVYRLETDRLEEMARWMLRRETLAQAAEATDADAYDRKVIAHYRDARGRIPVLPGQRKKFEAVLRYVLKDFKPGVRYTERQVNEMLARYNEDTALLRRELVAHGWLKRAGGGGEYWLPEEETSGR
jgi:predicted transcriptional regulator